MHNETKHEIIENYFIKLIKSNQYTPGEQLPSENEIADMFKVSRHTVRQALSFLSKEGWIYKERGKGSFYSRKEESYKKNIAVLTTYISDYIFPFIISGIEEELRNRGYNLLLFNSNNNIKDEIKCLEIISEQDIAGIILEPTQSAINDKEYEYIKKLQQNNIKCVNINANCNNIDTSYVIMDDEKGGYKQTKYLLQLGHKNIAGIFKIDDLQGVRRKNGYLKALEEENIEKNGNIIGEYITDNQDIYLDEFIRRILALNDRPTAIVCYNDKIAMRIIEECRHRDIRIPDDLSIVSYDDSFLAISSEVKLTTIRHPQKDMGIKAAKCIVDMIEGRSKSPKYLYDAELIVRESCKRI